MMWFYFRVFSQIIFVLLGVVCGLLRMRMVPFSVGSLVWAHDGSNIQSMARVSKVQSVNSCLFVHCLCCFCCCSHSCIDIFLIFHSWSRLSPDSYSDVRVRAEMTSPSTTVLANLLHSLSSFALMDAVKAGIVKVGHVFTVSGFAIETLALCTLLMHRTDQ